MADLANPPLDQHKGHCAAPQPLTLSDKEGTFPIRQRSRESVPLLPAPPAGQTQLRYAPIFIFLFFFPMLQKDDGVSAQSAPQQRHGPAT